MFILERLEDWRKLYAPVKISDKFHDFREIDDVRKVEFRYTRKIIEVLFQAERSSLVRPEQT